MTIKALSQEQLEKLRDFVYSGMESYLSSQTQADYLCLFCKRRAETNFSSVIHEHDCFGLELQKTLNEVE